MTTTPTSAPDTAQDDRVAATRDRLMNRGRAAIGVSGVDRSVPLRTVLKEKGLTLYPVIALGMLAFADSFQGFVIGIMAPEIARGLGVSVGTITVIVALRGFLLALGSVGIAQYVGQKPRRALIAKVTAIGWSVTTLFTAFVRTPFSLGALTAIDGASSSSVAALHTPMLMDTYPPEVRMRINSTHTLFLQSTAIAGPLLIALLVGPLDLTWRGVFLVLGVVSVLASLVGIGLKDPGFGTWDSDNVRKAVREDAGQDTDDVERIVAVESNLEDQTTLGFFEVARRLWQMPTLRKGLIATIIAGMGAAPFQTFFTFFLADRWGMSAAERGIFGAIIPIGTFMVIPYAAKLGDRLYKRDPADIMKLIFWLQAGGTALTVLAVVSPFFLVMGVAYALQQAVPAAFAPVMSTTFMAIVPAKFRSHMIALFAIAGAGAGALVGSLLLGGLEQRLGLVPAMLALMIPGIISLFIIRSMAKDINGDLDRTVEEIIEEEELALMREQGTHLPMLAVRNLNFSYGQVQVLFDVNFTVDEGEMVALLGTNGAGKSTLLNAISGINLPQSGSIRFHGKDITFLDAERRVGLGISQVPGGKSVFGPLSVVENLRLFGYSLGDDKRKIDAAIEESFHVFPRLAERRNQTAITLSGGEQQMLGLSQALILEPQLLCIDELSLGLAPKIVGELLDMVRIINQRGTSVVLVEQSATIALSLVDHAYFMERGEIRFDGAAADLIGRDDLLRSVFLEGASAGMAQHGHGSPS